jgi:hypothetical protein
MDHSVPNPRMPRHSTTEDIYSPRLGSQAARFGRDSRPQSSVFTNHDKPTQASMSSPAGAAAPIASDRTRSDPAWAKRYPLNLAGTPEQLNRERVIQAIELFYTTLPDDHRKLLDEIAAAELITVLQLISKVWAAKIALYMDGVEKVPTPEETAKLQELERIEHLCKHTAALTARRTEEQLNDYHAITQPYVTSDGTVIFSEPTTVNSASSWVPKAR